ncbi:hypothetical protein pdam_00014825 [Pocillopora damicornis]|uniref:SAGA-associated factor 11 homolog n=1 Tax=Pocillopora damicornis TaxID=46731 RepID=A0A3M6UKA7_POCDA|nr:hypothetical protein pdam_00014825 [Pocillopora damicornis]
MSGLLETGSSPSEVESLDLDEDSSLESGIVNELIDEAIVGVCLDIHRSVKQGVYSVLEQSDEKMLVSSTFTLAYFVVYRSLVILRQLVVEERCKGRIVKVVDRDGLDVFGQGPLKKQVECICPSCQRNMAANRFAPHLEKCLGMGRNSSRLARKKNKRDRGNSPRRAKAPRKNGEAGTPRPGTPSSVHSGELPATRTGLTVAAFEPLGNEEKKSLLSQTCGVISEHTARMCTRSHRCPQHSDEQRQNVRLRLLGYAEFEPIVGRSSLEADDVIDVDSYEDGDGQALRDTLNRLSWEEESNVSTGDDNSPAAFGSVPLSKKKRKKKAKHKRRPR